MIGRGAVSDNITIRTDKQKKRQVKLLAIKLGYDNVSEYISTLLDAEIKKYLQMALLEPEVAIMDETDSGLDIDSVKVVADGILKMYEDARGGMGVLVITPELSLR